MADDPQNALPSWATVQLGHGLTHSRYARHVRIEQLSHSIKGRYTIGPAAKDHHPPLFDMPVEQVTRQTSSSASFETRSSAISVEVWIMGDDDKNDPEGDLASALTHRNGPAAALKKDGTVVSKNKPVSVAAKSYMGRIHMAIPQYTPSRPLHLRAKSHNGSLYIFLPPTFSGLVSWRADSGSLKLSHAIRQRYISLGEAHKRRGTGMLLAKGQKKPEAHSKAVGRAKDVVEKKGLQPVSENDGSNTGGTNSPTGTLSGSSSVAEMPSQPSSSKDADSTAPSSPSSSSGSGELGLPATAAATAVSASGTVTRGDACELITKNGTIYLFEVGERQGSASLMESCSIM
ncbi:unnamed protein product [Sympodiomycopsis kandeliae]